MSLKLVEVEFSVWPFVKAAKRAVWVSERVQNRSCCERVKVNFANLSLTYTVFEVPGRLYMYVCMYYMLYFNNLFWSPEFSS